MFKKFFSLEQRAKTADLLGLCFPRRANCLDRKSSALTKCNFKKAEMILNRNENDEGVITT